MKDAKYLLAYSIPFAAFLSLFYTGIFAWSGLIFAFGVLPILDQLVPMSTSNRSDEEEESVLHNTFFDIMLYLNLPLLYVIVYYYFVTIDNGTAMLSGASLSWVDIIGMSLSMGILCGTTGINVAHELGHRNHKGEQLLAKALLLPNLYMHFFIEHNLGHHKNVATDLDPASSRFGESLYAFWFRSVIGGYVGAWKIEAERLRRAGKSAWHWSNEMAWYQVIQLLYLGVLYSVGGWFFVLAAFVIAIGGFTLLECVNYIEHYGLRREQSASGRYEPVLPKHSWNSNHELGRIILYELTRHSDHHYKSTRKYQVLRHHEDSPHLLLGYPGSILLSLVPPLWFRVMNKRVPKEAA